MPNAVFPYALANPRPAGNFRFFGGECELAASGFKFLV